MAHIKDRCKAHGDIDLSESDVVIKIDTSHREIPYYEFRCNNHIVTKLIDARILQNLMQVGVETVNYDSAANLDISHQDIQNQSATGRQAGIFAAAEAARFERLDAAQVDSAIQRELYSNPQG